MCGITGYVDWDRPVAGDVAAAMAATLRRRGPDASGVWTRRHVALGHARLSVLDPVDGAQRVPFLDHRLVEYAANIPWAMQTAGGIEKGVLRHAVADLLPAEVAWRPKSGYPAALLGRYQAALFGQVRALLAAPGEPLWQLVDPAVVRGMLDRHAGDLTDWTPTGRAGFLLELNAWLAGVRVL